MAGIKIRRYCCILKCSLLHTTEKFQKVHLDIVLYVKMFRNIFNKKKKKVKSHFKKKIISSMKPY